MFLITSCLLMSFSDSFFVTDIQEIVALSVSNLIWRGNIFQQTLVLSNDLLPFYKTNSVSLFSSKNNFNFNFFCLTENKCRFGLMPMFLRIKFIINFKLNASNDLLPTLHLQNMINFGNKNSN